MAFWNRRKESTPTIDDALVAAAKAVKTSRGNLAPKTNDQDWQEEVWQFHESLGEFRYAVSWKSEMISRVRLRAAKKIPGQDEPELIDRGENVEGDIAIDLITELAGGIGGQAQMMGSLTTQLDVPGEGWVVGETHPERGNEWRVYSNSEIRTKHRGRENVVYEVIDDEAMAAGKNQWRTLGSESMIIRVWRPNKRFFAMADSPAKAARDTMRELDLVNRKIQAQYLSRLASAGAFIIPDEVSFPVREEFAEEEDPFTAEWVETAATAIKNPGTASAVVPIPMRVPGEYADKFDFIDFSTADDEKIIEKRESAIRKLATQLDVPAEILLGMGDVNHWTAWQLEEGAIKSHISSDVELITDALTKGYLRPRLKAAGIDPDEFVVWYDASELTIRPDRSDDAIKVYDRGELSGAALRRETGFDEGDAPTMEELRGIILKVLARNPQSGFIALSELISDEKLLGRVRENSSPPSEDSTPTDEDDDKESRDEPDTQEDEPPPPDDSSLRVKMANTNHRIEVGINSWSLYHPEICKGNMTKCPVTEASRYLKQTPGTKGSYDCWLSSFGELIIGQRMFDVNSFNKGHTRTVLRNGNGKGKRPLARTSR